MATAPPTVTVARTYDEFLAMRPAWEALHTSAVRPLPFLRHGWLRLSWQRWASALSRPRAILISEGERPVMAAAFLFGWRRFRRVARFLDSGTPQYNDVLWADSERSGEHAAALLAALAAEPMAPSRLRATYWLEDSPLRSAIGGRRSVLGVRHATHHIRLADFAGFDAYFGSLDKKLRSDHRRRIRRFEEQHGPFAFVLETDDTRREVLHWLMTAKGEWAERTGRDVPWLSDGSGERFLADVLELDDGPECLLATLRVDGRIVAAALALRQSQTLYLSKIAYDPYFAPYSPGRTLIIKLIELAFSDQITLVDMMAGSGDWKHRFATGQSAFVSQKVYLR